MKSGSTAAPQVYLVGAGPGDPGLFTLKGRKLLQQADVIIYDHLANPELLAWSRPGAEKIDVGKQAGHHTLPQEQINQLLVQKAEQGSMVVRLKGGDPFVFGRGGEEAEYLRQHQMPYEVVPGVTSAIAVPAYAGIPVTHRNMASMVTLITGHPSQGRERLDWKHLAENDGTLVFLMGLGNLSVIAENLIKYGKNPATPAAVISHGTHNDQRTVSACLAEITGRVQQAGLSAPAVIVIGEVVSLRESLQWMEKRPLFGKKVLITRSEEQAGEFAGALRKKGAVPQICPLISIEPRDIHDEFQKFIREKSSWQWLVFTSVNGVQLFFKELFFQGQDVRLLAGCRIACIGEKTASALKNYGLRADIVPEVYQAEALAEALKQVLAPGDKVLLPRASKARRILARKLQDFGCQVCEWALYDTRAVKENQSKLPAYLYECDYLTFASSSAVQAFFQCLSAEDWQEIQYRRSQQGKSSIRTACIGPVTARTAAEYGIQADSIPSQYTLEEMLEAIEKDAVCQISRKQPDNGRKEKES